MLTFITCFQVKYFLYIFLFLVGFLPAQTGLNDTSSLGAQNKISGLLRTVIEQQKNNEVEKSVAALEEAAALTSKINYITDSATLDELVKCADKYVSAGLDEEAKPLISFALNQAVKQKRPARIADALFLKGVCQHHAGFSDSAIYNYRCAAAYYKRSGDLSQLINVYNNTDGAYYTMGNANGAHYEKLMNKVRMEFFELDSVLFFGIYLGAMLFCFIYNLYLYRFTKDASYRELAKCIFFFIIYIYTTNNEFAAHNCKTQTHYTILEFFKNNSIFLSNYFFATFIQHLLADRHNRLTKFYRFLSVYKNLLIVLLIASNVLAAFFLIKNAGFPPNYLIIVRLWFFFNAAVGLICTIVFFLVLFISAAKKKIRLNYLMYGFILDIIFISLAFAQGVMADRFSHIPYPHALGATLFLIFMTVAVADKINMYRKEKEDAQKEALTNLEKLVAERTADLKMQKQMVEEKNKEITDSITYAKRLQQAILPPLNFITEHLPESFVFYRPKDIVAGDFYWMEVSTSLDLTSTPDEKKKKEKLIFIAVADCTGHGVPGAMVSVVCSNALKRTVNEFGFIATGKILDKTRELVLETFERSESEVKDGMDISLLCIQSEQNVVHWSGANNPLWYINENGLQEIKADKQPIGRTDYPTPFTSHRIEYKPGTIFYLLTDGMADQFGGAKGKKFKYKQLKEILLANAKLSLKEQTEILDKRFESWKGNLEQVDDVCILGFRL